MQWKQTKSAHNSSTSKIGSYCNHKASHKAQLLTIRLASNSTHQTGEPEKKKSMRCLVHWNIYSLGRSPPPELPVPRRRSTPFPASNCQNTPPEERDRRRDAKTEREELYLSRIDALAQPHAAPIQIAAA